MLAAFDPVLAHTLGRRPELMRALMLVLLALTIVVSLQTVGVGLVAAMLVTPAATASLLTRRLPAMMAVAALVGVLSSVTGLYVSYYLDVASGAAIVLAATRPLRGRVRSSPRAADSSGEDACDARAPETPRARRPGL